MLSEESRLVPMHNNVTAAPEPCEAIAHKMNLLLVMSIYRTHVFGTQFKVSDFDWPW